MRTIALSLLMITGLLWTGCSADDIALNNSYEVAYIPSQCAPTHSFALGLKSPDNLYYLVSDQTGKFKYLKEGDRVEVVFQTSDEVIVCAACTCPAPDGAMIVSQLTKL